MTHTRTHARITRDGKRFVEDQLVKVRRKADGYVCDALYLATGSYSIERQNSTVLRAGPLWVIYLEDDEPFGLLPSEFSLCWERA